MTCRCCQGRAWTNEMIAYTRMPGGMGRCPRCKGSGEEPEGDPVHPGLMLRNVASGKVWVVYGHYEGRQGRPRRDEPNAWGIHRMVPARLDGRIYVWQIRIMPESLLRDPRRWVPTGLFGDAWDHIKMEADPLRGAA